MGLTRIKVVLRKPSKDAKRGYLKIRTTANRKSKYKTLNISLEEKYWNAKSEEIRKSHPRAKELNEFIQEEVRKHRLFGSIPTYTVSSDRSLLNYLLRHIENTVNPGTKNVRKATYKKFLDYLRSNEIEEFYFEDLTSDHVQKFYNYLRGHVAVNTAAHHIKTLRIAVNTAIKNGATKPYVINPFEGLKLKRVEPKITALTPLQVQGLQQENFLRPNPYLNLFLFSLFAQGLRKSDVLMLRWGNFTFEAEKLKLSYVVRKTQKEKSFNLSPMALYYLRLPLLEKFPNLQAKIEHLEGEIKDHNDNYETKNKELKIWSPETPSDKTKLLISLMEKGIEEERARLLIQKEIRDTQEAITYHETCMEEYEYEIYELCGKSVHKLAVELPKEFVFHSLRGMKLGKYLNNEEEYKIVDKKGKLYNYHLRKIGERYDIKKLTPHRARHTYMQLIHNSGANLQTIQYMAGHSDPKQTQAYIRRLNPRSAEDIDRKLSDSFSAFN